MSLLLQDLLQLPLSDRLKVIESILITTDSTHNLPIVDFINELEISLNTP